MYIIILIIVIIVLFYFFNLFLKNKITNKNTNKSIENFDNNINNIIFLNRDELLELLIDNNDNYYETFYNNDYKTRNIDTIEEYFEYIKSSVDNFDNDSIIKLKQCINNADLIMEKISFKWFDGKKANKIPWKLGCIKGKLYENGLPHTRSDVIIISKENVKDYNMNKLTKTLIHEKVHIYQKRYPDDMLIYLKENNFIKVKSRENDDNIRSNPDLDNFIYKDAEDNIYKATYLDNAVNIEDIKYSPIDHQSYEHPYEKMAIFIEKMDIKN
jgi:hypothetical protein